MIPPVLRHWLFIPVGLVAIACVLSLALYACQPWVNPLDYPQKIDAPREIPPHHWESEECEC